MHEKKFPIPNFDGYFITRNGEVYSNKTTELIKLGYSVRKQKRVTLFKNGTGYNRSVSRLMAKIFPSEINKQNLDEKYYVVMHLNGNISDNSVENLKCVDSRKKWQWLQDIKANNIIFNKKQKAREGGYHF